MTVILTGPRKSGRSLLARIFAAKTDGTMIDDAERVAESDIFHAWNRAQAEHRPLLIVAEEIWSVKLPDLRSRLAATPVLTTLKLFRHEFEAHVREGRCTLPAEWRASRPVLAHAQYH
jgi:hypothetical protein